LSLLPATLGVDEHVSVLHIHRKKLNPHDALIGTRGLSGLEVETEEMPWAHDLIASHLAQRQGTADVRAAIFECDHAAIGQTRERDWGAVVQALARNGSDFDFVSPTGPKPGHFGVTPVRGYRILFAVARKLGPY
jgi:hypothetical protein